MEQSGTRGGSPDLEGYRLMRSVELFSTLLDDDLSYLSTRLGTLNLGPGQTLFRAGEKARRFFIVVSGEVNVLGEGERPLAHFLPGEALGDFDFSIGASYQAEARTVGQTVLREFPDGGLSLEDLTLEAPDVVARIKLRSLAMVSSRIRDTHRLMADNEPWVRELRRQVYTDPPTGLWSADFLRDEASKCLAAPSAFIMVKPDRFKDLVDERGHQAGDEAMSLIAECLQARAAAFGCGWAFRLRSNETALLLPACPEEEAERQAADLRDALDSLSFKPEGNPPAFRISASVCLGLWPQDESDFKRLCERVEIFLLKAWEAGGDRYCRLPATGSRAREKRS